MQPQAIEVPVFEVPVGYRAVIRELRAYSWDADPQAGVSSFSIRVSGGPTIQLWWPWVDTTLRQRTHSSNTVMEEGDVLQFYTELVTANYYVSGAVLPILPEA